MVEIRFEKYDPEKCSNNVLYRIDENTTIRFTEEHEHHKEIVFLHFQLENGQYAVYANEYRNPLVVKRGCKTADVLILIVDEREKRVFSLIFDVKSNISAFSDNLLLENAMITPLKEIRDFLEQLEDTLKSKNAVIALYDADYSETENIGIVTRNFDTAKFEAVAEMYDKIYRENETANSLTLSKLRNSLRPYGNIVERVRQFARKEVELCNKTYRLHTCLLKKNDSGETMPLSADSSACRGHADENKNQIIYSTNIRLSIEEAASDDLLP